MVEPRERSKVRSSADFLTLLASQERKVLELKEELQKAQTDLSILKRQWASYEANKKRDEVKHIKKLQALALEDVDANEMAHVEGALDEERRRKKALVERSHVANATPNLGRRGSKRIFEGSRHTRTLSLLSPTSTKPGSKRETDEPNLLDETVERESHPTVSTPSVTQMPTLDSLISGDPLQLGFGKTYKELAAHRRSLPPVATDLLVRQGKQVYDGVKEGLWTFFEDIRQATVGEEGVNGTASQQRPVRPNQRKASRKPSETSTSRRSIAKSPVNGPPQPPKEPSFWGEFGLDTPRRPLSSQAQKLDHSSGHVQQKSSTDSSHPPSLTPDLNDTDDVEDAWDTWDSPASNRDLSAMHESKKRSDDALPWPEIQKLTPSKLTRTVSDLMRDWDSGQGDGNDGHGTDISKDLGNGQSDLLESLHM